MIQPKRVYEPAIPQDGTRILVKRLWPRGIKKEALRFDAWLKDTAPSTELRRWFAHDPARWPACGPQSLNATPSPAIGVMGTIPRSCETDIPGIQGRIQQYALWLIRPHSLRPQPQHCGLRRSRLKSVVDQLDRISPQSGISDGEIAAAVGEGSALLRKIHMNIPILAVPLLVAWAIGQRVVM
jgi:hypothetical protein